MLSFILLISLTPLLALSYPLEDAKAPQSCSNDAVYDHVSACASGTRFCESYLHIKAHSTHTVTVTTTASPSETHTVHARATTTITSTLYTTTATKTEKRPTSTITTCKPTGVHNGNVFEMDAFGSGYYDSVTYSKLMTVSSGGVELMERYAMPITEAPEATPEAQSPKKSCGIQSSVSSRKISNACSCFIRATTTVTYTVTTLTTAPTITTTDRKPVTTTKIVSTGTTTTVAPTKYVGSFDVCKLPDASCHNKGLAWAYYRVPKNLLDTEYDPESNYFFVPEVYKGLSPQYTGHVEEIGGWRSSGIDNSSVNQAWDIYGHKLGEQHSVLDHVTYFYPPLTGIYEFNIQNADNTIYLWTGEVAYSGWVYYNGYQIPYEYDPTSIPLYFYAGQYYAMRILFGSGISPDSFGVSLTAPDGTILLESNQAPSPYFVRFSCGNKSEAPPFPPFGHET